MLQKLGGAVKGIKWSTKTIPWDLPSSKEEKSPWIKIIKQLIKTGSITFNKPVDVDLEQEVILISYSDRSDTAKVFVAFGGREWCTPNNFNCLLR